MLLLCLKLGKIYELNIYIEIRECFCCRKKEYTILLKYYMISLCIKRWLVIDMQEYETVIMNGTKNYRRKHLKDILSKPDIYAIFQVFWLLEVYYLMVNSIINIIAIVQKDNSIISSTLKLL